MKSFFKEMFEYTHHFNEKVIGLLLMLDNVPEKSLRLLNHTINAHEIWNARIESKIPSVGVWELRHLDDLKAINLQNNVDTLRVLDNFGFETIINYSNSQGHSFSNTVGEILFHAGNHSTYHRGQIATDLKEHGITPIATDYIFYKRQSL